MPGSFSRASTMALDGKIVLVTGAGRGIGKALALGFAKAGAHVVVVSRTQTEIEATAREAQAIGGQSLVIKADISQPHDVQRMADQVRNRFGRLDVLVNNAALRMNQLGKKDSYYIPFVNLSLDDWDTAMNVNLRGPFLCIKECLPLMRNSARGQHHQHLRRWRQKRNGGKSSLLRLEIRLGSIDSVFGVGISSLQYCRQLPVAR